MIVVIDNYDSFTYNLVQYLQELGRRVVVYRNDAITTQGIININATHIILSPGPCTPNEAGISMEVIKTLGSQIPILGVCLGHQCIGQVFGAQVVRSPQLMHGKTSRVFHDGRTIFRNIENPFTATRYHSLILSPETIPPNLEVSAETQQGEIMAVRHRELPIEGVQFHPESILTTQGRQMLENFLHYYT